MKRKTVVLESDNQLEQSVIESVPTASKGSLNETLKKFTNHFIESTSVIIIMMAVTLWVLFSDDIRQLSVDADRDIYFFISSLVCFGLFSIEIILTFYSNSDYRWSFFFYLDILSTLSLLLDVGWISDIIFGNYNNVTNPKSAASFAKTARASRIGTRASRVVRIIRLIRLIRIVKLYKGSMQAQVKAAKKKKKQISTPLPKINFSQQPELGEPSKSEEPGNISPSREFPTPQQNPSEGEAHRKQMSPRRISSSHNVGVNLTEQQAPPGLTLSAGLSKAKDPQALQGVHFGSSKLDMSMVASLNKPMAVERDALVSQAPENKLAISFQLPPEGGNTSKIDSVEGVKMPAEVQISEFDEIDPHRLFQESNVGRQLSDLTVKRVIILILSIMISIPLFSLDTYWPDYSSYQSGIQNLNFLLHKNTDLASNIVLQKAWFSYFAKNTDPGMIDVLVKLTLIQKNSSEPDLTNDLTGEINNLTNTTAYFVSKDYIDNKLRAYEKLTIVDPSDVDTLAEGEYSIAAIYDISQEFNFNSYLGIGRTVFVCLVLMLAAIFFGKNANELVLRPIENMVQKVRRISHNPIHANRVEEEQEIFWDNFYKTDKKKKLEKEEENDYETTILEKTIARLGKLLAVGFGDIGIDSVSKNIHQGKEVDPMIAGKKVMAVMGCCSVRKFHEVVEALEESSAQFVNEIAEIVHTTVDDHSGVVAKNSANSFVLIWKFEDTDIDFDTINQVPTVRKESPRVKATVELAILSAIRLQLSLAKSKRLRRYQANTKIIELMGTEEFKVNVGMSLHIGWGVEGTLGSKYKVDGAILSQQVTVTRKLEEVGRLYSLPIIVSGALKEIARDGVRNILRYVDLIRLAEYEPAIELHTVDLDLTEIYASAASSDEKEEEAKGVELLKEHAKKRIAKDELKEKMSNALFDARLMISLDDTISKARKKYTEHLFKDWNTALNHYLKGEWRQARDKFEKLRSVMLNDGPLENIFEFMKKHEFTCPEQFKSGRIVTLPC